MTAKVGQQVGKKGKFPSPRFRLIVNLVSTLVISVLTNVYAGQIAPNGTLDWSLAWHVSSFWSTVVAALIWIWINFAFFKFDERESRYQDAEYAKGEITRIRIQAYERQMDADPDKVISLKQLREDLGI